MNFKPCSEDEIAAGKLWPKAVYPFEVVAAFEKLSKAGKPMIELKLRVSNGDGRSRMITDYLVAQRLEKLRHAAAACGVLERYDAGSLSNADFLGKSGRLKLGVEKDKTGQYPPKNVVADYLW